MAGARFLLFSLNVIQKAHGPCHPFSHVIRSQLFLVYMLSLCFNGGATYPISCTYINSNIAQLRPAHSMVQIVFAKVVLRQICDVGKLDMWNVFRS
jgi:hypothetical protein